MNAPGIKSIQSVVAEKGTPISLEWIKLSNKEDLHKVGCWMYVNIQNKRQENIELTNDEAIKVNKQADGSLIFWFATDNMIIDEAQIPANEWTMRANYDFEELRQALDKAQTDPRCIAVKKESESKTFVRGEVHFAIIGREPAGIHMLHNFANGVKPVAQAADIWFNSNDSYLIFSTSSIAAHGESHMRFFGIKTALDLHAAILAIGKNTHDITKTSMSFYGLRDSVLDIAKSKWTAMGGISQT